ncbi:hypothetical protein MVES1_002650 [Malassezia vespertilionis]|uniref:uncharacterized protein n=1 Tax=Malassezia vespertilionis TaxID=2020962 RepID=UPI0024B0FAB6|nr:uncharacterized protein MVES1_002650 [Malassezia vespertilionis]WFD07289.1 hypothetical protein MVES1_002650 [Malassezia vespertilionis]
MTSYFMEKLGQHGKGSMAPEECVFCDIVARRQQAFIVYEDASTMAFLDVLPIRPVIPKMHVAHITQLESVQAADLMQSIVRVARAMEKAFRMPGLQVGGNQVYGQVVDHVHFHIVPAPPESSSPLYKWKREPPKMVIPGHRDQLSDEEGEELCALLRNAVQPSSHL